MMMMKCIPERTAIVMVKPKDNGNTNGKWSGNDNVSDNCNDNSNSNDNDNGLNDKGNLISLLFKTSLELCKGGVGAVRYRLVVEENCL